MPTLSVKTVNNSGVEQLAARQAHNLEVVGSSPTPATNDSRGSSVVERSPEEAGVGGSIPSRGTAKRQNASPPGLNCGLVFIGDISGVWPSWSKASGLGPEDREFESRHPDTLKKKIILPKSAQKADF